jgi:long-subunit acyl-CoA synthetase (AMP-forming)
MFEETLPAWLDHQAEQRGQSIALRHKHHGIWQPLTWSEVRERVGRLALALAGRGFRAGQALLLVSNHPCPQGVLLALAAQWLGGVAVPVDPALAAPRIPGNLTVRLAFVENEGQLARLRPVLPGRTTVIYADGRGLIEGPELVSFDDFLAGSTGPWPAPVARSEAVAFAFLAPAPHRVGHGELLEGARQLCAAERLDHREEALVSREFATSAHARCVIGPWLLAGFRLNFPETIATRDHDRRELGPTLLVGTAASYGRLAARVAANLPEPGTLGRRLIERGLRPAGRLMDLVGRWLVRRPLRDVLGLSRTRVALIVGPPLEGEVGELFGRLGIHPHGWPDHLVSESSSEEPARAALP